MVRQNGEIVDTGICAVCDFLKVFVQGVSCGLLVDLGQKPVTLSQ